MRKNSYPVNFIRISCPNPAKEKEIETQLEQREFEAHERVGLDKLKFKNEHVTVEKTNVVGVDKTVENAKKAQPKFSESVDLIHTLPCLREEWKIYNGTF